MKFVSEIFKSTWIVSAIASALVSLYSDIYEFIR